MTLLQPILPTDIDVAALWTAINEEQTLMGSLTRSIYRYGRGLVLVNTLGFLQDVGVWIPVTQEDIMAHSEILHDNPLRIADAFNTWARHKIFKKLYNGYSINQLFIEELHQNWPTPLAI